MMKRIIAIWMTLVMIIAFASCAKQSEQTETSAQTELTETSTETVKADPAQVSAAYAAFLGKYDAFEFVYIYDFNKDGYPEIIGKAEDLMQQFVLTYTDKGGLSVLYPNAYSGLGVQFFVTDDNLFYYRDDGHTTGSAYYHSAYVYSIDETGFALQDNLYGEDWPDDIEYTDEVVWPLDEKYDALFDDKLAASIGNKTVEDCSEMNMPEDLDAYLNEELNMDISSARQAYADAQASLREAVIDTAGQKPKDLFVSDYDRNGTYEAFAFVEETREEYFESVGSVWFANAQGEVKKIQTDVMAWDELGVLSCAYHDYFQAPLVSVSSRPASVWKVQSGTCVPVDLFDMSETSLEIVNLSGSVYLSPNTLISTLGAFDATFMETEDGEPTSTGHTHKPYFFRDTPEGIKEYGGLNLTQSEVEKIPGGKELIDLAKKDGKKIESIYYRENNIVSFSMSKQSEFGTNYYYFTALYAEGKFILLDSDVMYPCDENGEYLSEGFYISAANPDEATFPQKMTR